LDTFFSIRFSFRHLAIANIARIDIAIPIPPAINCIFSLGIISPVALERKFLTDRG